MNEFVRLLLLVALAGTVVTVFGSAAIWFMDEERRMGRALRRVLKGAPEAVILARGRGKAAGFHFGSGLAAVTWDAGAWCLVYRLDELMGAELIVDGQVAARAFRGEPRRALDHVGAAASEVSLRLIFDDPRHPDFELDLWMAGDEKLTPARATQEANRWLARAEAILRRPPARPAAEAPPQVATGRPDVEPRRAELPPRNDLEDGDEAPWDEDELEDEDDDTDAPRKPIA
jgi:hypothetical protein